MPERTAIGASFGIGVHVAAQRCDAVDHESPRGIDGGSKMHGHHTVMLDDGTHVDALPRQKRRLAPETIKLMRKARTVDPFTRWVVDTVAFGLSMQEQRPSDFAVIIEDAQEVEWESYAALGVRPPVALPHARGKFNVRLVFGDDGDFRVDIDDEPNSGHGRVHIRVDRAGGM